MGKKVIQVPLDEGLLKDLNNLSKKQHKARAKVIREACQHYLLEAEREEMDRLYQRGYERIPETSEFGEAQLAVLGEVLSKETW